MLQVKMTKNLKNYEVRVAAGMTMKQLIGIFVGLMIAVPIIVLLMVLFPIDIMLAAVIGVLCGAPAFAYGFVDYNGLSLTDIIAIFLNDMKSPKVRPYVQKTVYMGLTEEELLPKEKTIQSVTDLDKYRYVE